MTALIRNKFFDRLFSGSYSHSEGPPAGVGGGPCPLAKIGAAVLAVMLIGGLLGGCDREQKKREEAERAAARAAQAALDRAAGEAVNAAQEDYFRPSPEEAAFLDAAVAVNQLGTPNGYFSNQDGVSGYFQGYRRPFNFTWKGAAVEIEGFDGRRHRVIDGPGELTLKYTDDDLLLQRYQGEYRAGFWQGHGRLWTRNREAGGHNYFFYQGNFDHDHFEGRGVMDNYNFNGRGNPPFRYEGEFSNGSFHGQGLVSDLSSGQMNYKGLWAEGRPYRGSREQWEKERQKADLESGERQYSDPLMTDQLNMTAHRHPAPGSNPLSVILPEGAELVFLSDGRRMLDSPLRAIAHPVEKTPEGQPLSVEAITADFNEADYPLTLTLAYDDQGGRRQYLRFTAKRSFILELEPEDQEESEEELLKKPLDGELEERLKKLEDRLRRERLSPAPAI